MEKKPITTIQELINLYTSVYYMEETDAIPLVVAAAISFRIPGDPTWLMIVAGSSSGKSELINALMGLRFVHQVSQLTENTFLSGAQRRGVETSLLKKIGLRGVMVMKDFTSILSLPNDRQVNIMGQLREIYDGHFVKHTGMGEELCWGPGGKLGLIAASTEEIHAVQAKFSSMGTRMLYYTIPEQDRKKTVKRAFKNQGKWEELRRDVQNGFKQYIEATIKEHTGVGKEIPQISEELRNELIDLTDFTAKARSPVNRDFHQNMSLVLSPEMPMRIANQVFTIGSCLMMQFGEENDTVRRILYKLSLDSIPKQRRLALRILSQHRSVTTTALAQALNYPTMTVQVWLEDLNAIHLCDKFSTDSGTYRWQIKEEYREMMCKYDNLTYKDNDLELDDGTVFNEGGFYSALSRSAIPKQTEEDDNMNSTFDKF